MATVTAKFNLGSVVATPGALEALHTGETSAAELLQRHVSGDWGDVDASDAAANNRGLRKGKEERIMSVYELPTGEKVWVITEWDRSVTTILLPSEY